MIRNNAFNTLLIFSHTPNPGIYPMQKLKSKAIIPNGGATMSKILSLSKLKQLDKALITHSKIIRMITQIKNIYSLFYYHFYYWITLSSKQSTKPSMSSWLICKNWNMQIFEQIWWNNILVILLSSVSMTRFWLISSIQDSSSV